MTQKPIDLLSARWWILSVVFGVIAPPLLVMPLWLSRHQSGLKASITILLFVLVLNFFKFQHLIGALNLIPVVVIFFLLDHYKDVPATKEQLIQMFSPFLSIVIFFGAIVTFLWLQVKGLEVKDIHTELDKALMLLPDENKQQLVETLKKTAIGVVTASLIFYYVISYFAYIWAVTIITKSQNAFRNILKASIPKLIMWLMGGCILLTLTSVPLLVLVGENFVIIGTSLYVLQGIFIAVSYLLSIDSTKRNRPLVLDLLMLLVVFIIFPFLFIALGIVDHWADFRKLKKANVN